MAKSKAVFLFLVVLFIIVLVSGKLSICLNRSSGTDPLAANKNYQKKLRGDDGGEGGGTKGRDKRTGGRRGRINFYPDARVWHQICWRS
jgi:hypothetical protein